MRQNQGDMSPHTFQSPPPLKKNPSSVTFVRYITCSCCLSLSLGGLLVFTIPPRPPPNLDQICTGEGEGEEEGGIITTMHSYFSFSYFPLLFHSIRTQKVTVIVIIDAINVILICSSTLCILILTDNKTILHYYSSESSVFTSVYVLIYFMHS